MSGPFVQLKVWFPQKNSRNKKYNYGHISMLIPNRFIPEHLRDSYGDRDCYISYVKAQGSQRGFRIVDNYDEDQRDIMSRQADKAVNIPGLDISVMLEKHIEYVSKFGDGIGNYHLASADSLYDGAARDFGGVAELESSFPHFRVDYLGEANCTEYVWMLLQAGGLKKPQQFSKEAGQHFGIAMTLGVIWMALGLKYKNQDVLIAGLSVFLYADFMCFIGLVACCYRSVVGQGAAMTPSGLFNIARQSNDSSPSCYDTPFAFFKCMGNSGLAFSGFWLMFNLFCIASLTKVDGLKYASLGIGGVCLLTAIVLQCRKMNSPSEVDNEDINVDNSIDNTMRTALVTSRK